MRVLFAGIACARLGICQKGLSLSMIPQPPHPISLDAFLDTACAPTAPESDAELYALVDHSGARGLLANLQRLGTLSWRSLFEGSTEAQAIDAAPLLIALPDGGHASSERELLRWLHRQCSTTSCVVTMRSSLAADALFNALRARLNVLLPQHVPVMLRYFDTRTLAVLPTVLTAEQRTGFFGIARRWFWLNRYGQAETFNSALSPEVDTWPSDCELNDTQEAALIESGNSDAVVFQLVQSAPDIVREHGRLALHMLAERHAPAMRRFHLDSVQMQTLYCMAAVEHGDDFAQSDRWKASMGRVAAGQLSFTQAVSEVGA
jgi:hypothetical protein